MSKPTHAYLQITEKMNNTTRHLYFISTETFNDDHIANFTSTFTGDFGIIDMYMKSFPNRTLSVSIGKYHTDFTPAENSTVYTVKHTAILNDSFTAFSEVTGKGLFEYTDIYTEKGLFAYYENYEVKEKMRNLLHLMEAGEDVDVDAEELYKWINQRYVF